MFGKSPAFAKIIPRTEGNKKLPFGNQLHAYTIVDAINDKNVLPFRVDYIKTMDMEEDIDDKQIEINIDYILMLVKKYHDSHCDDKEVLITIQKAIDASPELRSKKALMDIYAKVKYNKPWELASVVNQAFSPNNNSEEPA